MRARGRCHMMGGGGVKGPVWTEVMGGVLTALAAAVCAAASAWWPVRRCWCPPPPPPSQARKAPIAAAGAEAGCDSDEEVYAAARAMDAAAQPDYDSDVEAQKVRGGA